MEAKEVAIKAEMVRRKTELLEKARVIPNLGMLKNNQKSCFFVQNCARARQY